MMRFRSSLPVAVLLAGTVLHAQGAAPRATLKEIGKTSVGTPVMLETASVSRSGTVVTAIVRVALSPPLKHTNGELVASRTISMFDCARQTAATRESWYYHDAAMKKEGMHRVVAKPGFGPAFKGSLADVALAHVCAATAPAR
ncbi:MAG: hypothetical protein IBJ03_11655 [Gemmatimonadaceae bacterium]|nr:hypothetical protein [Gemmatimonadaceae bacterium]